MTILPDLNLYIQIINFLALLFILNFILYRPVRKMLGERKATLDEFARAREEFETRSVLSNQKLQEQNDAAKQKGNQAKTSLVQEALTGQEHLLREAAVTAQQKVEKERAEINAQEITARRALEQDLDSFSKALADKILRRNG
ncbi:MAG: hypothetical protein EHM45_16660 [Desulfobacteraceae bacterium]|nr:MAG: hypothetical protein EHM45_16660 [Desulfobacteraceae bacterium]